MFKPLAQQGGLVLATMSTLGRAGLRALLATLLTLLLIVAGCWLVSAPDSAGHFLLRLHDPAVLWAVWQILSPEQKTSGGAQSDDGMSSTPWAI